MSSDISSSVGTGFILFFFFNDTATTEIYTLSLHDALPIFTQQRQRIRRFRNMYTGQAAAVTFRNDRAQRVASLPPRSEEHTSELQSRPNLVCRLLLLKKKKKSTHFRFFMYISHTF